MIRPCRIFVAGAGLLSLAACSLVSGDSARKPFGLAVGDEPIAVRAGAAALAEGGSAADAVATMYFALSVTYPVAAGIGGGGLCIVHEPSRRQDQEVDFLARDAAHSGVYAVPGSVSGFALVHSSYGKLPWQRVVADGEGVASAGFQISHALAPHLMDNRDVIRLDAGLATEFLDESGNIKPEGSVVNNPALAQTLAAIRTSGPAGLYEGSVAERLVAYSGGEGGAISASDLRTYVPGRGDATSILIAEQSISLPSRRVGAGAFLSAMLSALVDRQHILDAPNNLAAKIASATKSTLDEFHLASVPRDLGATGFAAIDNNGQAVACAVTMNGPFGSGHTAAGTGVVLARAPSSGGVGLAAAFLAPIIVQHASSLTLVGAGAGWTKWFRGNGI